METKKILVPTDFSETAYKALLHAAALAEHSKAEIHLVHVLQFSAISMFRAPEINLLLPSSYHFFCETRRQQMESIKRWVLEKYQVTIQTDMPEGDTVEQLRKYVEQHQIDFIVLHDLTKRNWWSRLFKNKADIIQERIPVPVITILDAAEKPFNWSDVVIPVTDTIPELRISTIAAFAEKFKIRIHFVALQALGKAKKPFNVLMDSLRYIQSKCKAAVICRELKGNHLHDAARAYAEKIHANALIENNKPNQRKEGIINRIARYFEKTEYPYITPGMI